MKIDRERERERERKKEKERERERERKRRRLVECCELSEIEEATNNLYFLWYLICILTRHNYN